jgi:hypothetical protein
MAEQGTPDDIKIIAQFLAGQTGTATEWSDHKQAAFKLRQQLKQRGGYRLVKNVQSQ